MQMCSWRGDEHLLDCNDVLSLMTAAPPPALIARCSTGNAVSVTAPASEQHGSLLHLLRHSHADQQLCNCPAVRYCTAFSPPPPLPSPPPSDSQQSHLDLLDTALTSQLPVALNLTAHDVERLAVLRVPQDCFDVYADVSAP